LRGGDKLNNVKLIREATGLTQKALAEAASISAPFLHDLENGNRNARPETWARIAKVLGCTVEDLKDREEEPA
jgi:transcriptional regulator with XRE-family HTH domain